MTTQEITSKIETLIQSIINNGSGSNYFGFDFNDETWKIRVSNHGANPLRVDNNTISLVVVLPDVEDEEYSNMSINKKSFPSLSNQYYLNENGDFTENFSSIEEFVEYHFN